MEKKPCNKEILKLLAEKSSTKQFVFRQSKELFKKFKTVISEIAEELNSNICNIDDAVVVEYKDTGEYEAQIHFSGDVIIFQMHSNVFTFEKNHHIFKTSYIKDDPMRAYFGEIHMYNFLADSFRYDRSADYGFLMGRVFVNKDQHFFMEGQRQFGFMFNNLPVDVFEPANMRHVVERSMVYALDFDLTAPNFNEMREVTVNQITAFGSSLNLSTRKKLGFKFSYENYNKVK